MKNLAEEVSRYKENIYDGLKDLDKMISQLAKIELSDEVYINPGGGSCWIDVRNREDLQTALTICEGVWTKETAGSEIHYDNQRDGISYRIKATDDALPATCKLVEEEYIEPARPAYTAKRL